VDGVNVTGAFGWAAYDNFEWFEGSHVKFGLQYLNQTSLERSPKASMFQFLDWFKLHGIASLGTGSAGGNASAIPMRRSSRWGGWVKLKRIEIGKIRAMTGTGMQPYVELHAGPPHLARGRDACCIVPCIFNW
jgi:hypothetical protein